MESPQSAISKILKKDVYGSDDGEATCFVIGSGLCLLMLHLSNLLVMTKMLLLVAELSNLLLMVNMMQRDVLVWVLLYHGAI